MLPGGAAVRPHEPCGLLHRLPHRFWGQLCVVSCGDRPQGIHTGAANASQPGSLQGVVLLRETGEPCKLHHSASDIQLQTFPLLNKNEKMLILTSDVDVGAKAFPRTVPTDKFISVIKWCPLMLCRRASFMQTRRRAAYGPAWAQGAPSSSLPYGRMLWSHRRMRQWLGETFCTPLILGEVVAVKIQCEHKR